MKATYAEKIGAAKALIDQAIALQSDPNATAEQKSHIQKMVDDARALQADAMVLKDLEGEYAKLAGPLSAVKNHLYGGRRVVEPSPFGSFGNFLYEVWAATNPNIKAAPHPALKKFSPQEDEDDEPSATKTLTGATGASGGFLIPDGDQQGLMAVVGEIALVRGRATIIPIRRRSVPIPVLDQTGTTAGQPHWFGGMRFYWAEEGALKTESEPAFRMMQLIARKLVGYTRSTDELLDDSAVSLEAFFSGPLGFAGGVAWMEDYAFLTGNGAGKPQGVIPAPGTIAVARNAAGDIQFNDLARMLQAFLPSGRGVWFATQSAMAQIIQMNGPSGHASYIWTPNARDGLPSTLMGLPIIWTEKLPGLGSKGDIMLGDWRYYLLGDRQATTVESTKFDRWQYDETSWRIVHRVGGAPWLSAPLTLQDGTTQVSPFVVLDSTVS